MWQLAIGNQLIFLCWLCSSWQLNWCVNSQNIIAFRNRNWVHLCYRPSMDFGAQLSHRHLQAAVSVFFYQGFQKRVAHQYFASRWICLHSFPG